MCRCEGSDVERKSGRAAAGVRLISRTLLLSCSSALLLFSPGCQQEMANQPRYDAMEPLPELAEGARSLGPIQGTVARGQMQSNGAYFTGKQLDQLVTEIPGRALDGRSMEQLLERGQQRYVVFCAHCHGQVGGGSGGDDEMQSLVGMVVQRGFPMPPTFHQPRLRDAPIGHFFDVITNGLGRMPAHGYLVPPQDRWSIAVYIRALQLSQNAPRDELASDDLQKLEASSNP
jgi:mono/diheme cytochrome c family protein